ncbi:MAG TPA: TIGR02221 family CRISPR-associated protein [Candidatus Cloacimonadota bacterium]|nr:TIGR02221 family CRISPR-associated protein [Candidatus Cloacimonadota bacterium]HQL15385.1 TIGR02221 family CRISPR-associated protein [Candidatus Cloacimonadota bacterium]
MAKVLIFSLGTGQKKDGGYRKTNYNIEGKIYRQESLAAKCYCEHYGIEKMFVIGTIKSLWDDLYLQFGGEDEAVLERLYTFKEEGKITSEELSIVQDQLNNRLGSKGSKCFLIKYGQNEAELLENFSILMQIADNLTKKDEVYLDITHSFRSLALMSFLMLNYIWEVKNTKNTKNTKNIKKKQLVKKVLYAMGELIFESPNPEEAFVPVVDLSLLFDIMQWIKAVSNFQNFGNVQLMADLVDNFKNQKLSYDLHDLADSFSLNKLANIRLCLQRLKNDDLLVKELDKHPITATLKGNVQQMLNRFDLQNLAKFQYDLANWYMDNKAYGLAYLCLAECIISKGCELNGLDEKEIKNREAVKCLLQGHPKRNKKGIAAQLNPKTIPTDIADCYEKVCNTRNTIAHQVDDDNGNKQNLETSENNKKLIKDLHDWMTSVGNFINQTSS